MYKRHPNLNTYPIYDPSLDKLDLSEINHTEYVKYNQSAGLVQNASLLKALRPICYFYKHKGSSYREYYLPRWFVILYKAIGSRRKKFHDFLVWNLDKIENLAYIWKESKDLNQLLSYLENEGFFKMNIGNSFTFHYMGLACRYFINEKCLEINKHLKSWDHASPEEFNRIAPIENNTVESIQYIKF